MIDLSQLLANGEWARMRSATSDFVDGVDDIFLAQQNGGKQISQGGIIDLPKAWVAFGSGYKGNEGRNCKILESVCLSKAKEAGRERLGATYGWR